MYTILVIDDDEDVIEIVQRKLKAPSLRFLSAEGGREGILIARSALPNLILLDWQMPGFSGIETVQALRADELTRAIPVMMMTGVMKESQHLEAAFDAGASDFIRKPIDGIELRSRVNAAISLREEQKKRQELEHAILKQEIVRSEQALVELSLQFSLNNQVADRFIRELRTNLVGTPVPHSAREIERIIRKFRIEMFDVNWKTFESKFMETHAGFSAALKRQCSDMTENELKLCALYGMGLSTQDISAITFISYEGVRKARTRLRKKLQLPSQTDLTEFLKTQR